MDKFSVATYNVNSLRSRLHIVIPWLELNRPDVLCLQETKVEDSSFPRDAFAKIGYHVILKGEKQYNGVAIASRVEPREVSCGLDDEGPHDQTRLIRGIFSGVRILNTYVPQGKDPNSPQFAYKLQWLERLANFIAKHYSPDEPLIWCGDINIAPDPLDVYDPKRLLGHVCFNPLVWEALAKITSWGLIDVFRKHHPGEPKQYTFFDYRLPNTVERGLGWRIDHIFATSVMGDRSLNCTIDLAPRRQEKPSDHAILWAEFKRL